MHNCGQTSPVFGSKLDRAAYPECNTRGVPAKRFDVVPDPLQTSFCQLQELSASDVHELTPIFDQDYLDSDLPRQPRVDNQRCSRGSCSTPVSVCQTG